MLKTRFVPLLIVAIAVSYLAPIYARPIFEEVAEKVGLDFRHYNGMTGKFFLPEIMGAGAALFDYDNDGDLDVFLVQGSGLEANTKPGESPRGKLFRNDLETGKDGSRKVRFTDVTEKSRILANGYGMGVAAGDINNDGWTDLYLTNLGSNRMYLNKGDGTFADVTSSSGTDDLRWSTSAAFLDYDRDGWLDLMLVNYADFSTTNSPTCYAQTSARDYCMPRVFRAPGNRLLHNRGDGTFADVTVAAGIDKEFGHGLGVVSADFNDDGWIDIYVANDGDANQLWINQKDGTFKNDALLAGVAVNRDGRTEAGMGLDAGDFDGNGTDDVFVTHLMEETNTLFTNLGNAVFEDRTREAGLGMPGRRFTGFGTLFFDYDNDGRLDLFVANGAVQLLPELMRKGDPFPLGQPNQLFRNAGNGRFIEMIDQAGPAFQFLEVSRGAAFGDVDNDGDTDVLVTNNNGPVRLLLNQPGNRNHWLGLRFVSKSGRDLLGTQVEIVITKNQILRRRVRTDGSYLSANDARVLVGLGDVTRVETVRVRWPDGSVGELKSPLVDRYVTVKNALHKNPGNPANRDLHAHSNVQRVDYLPPPRPTLVAVHWPDLAQLESDVRDQIKSYQDVLIAAVKDASSTDTKLSDTYGSLGEIYQAYSLTAPARECYLNASRLAPQDFRWIYLLAKLDHLEGRVDDAIRRYQMAASLQPAFVAALVNLGNIYLELNRLEEAENSFATALQKEVNNPAAHYGRGQVALSRRNYAEAVEHFEKALALAPEANRIHYALAMAYRRLGNMEKARMHLAQQGSVGVRVADPLMDGLLELIQGVRVHLVRGKLALEAKRYQDAADEFRKAIEARPDSVPAHVNLGATLTQLGDLKGAVVEFEKAVLLDPNNTNAHYNLAVLLAGENQHQQAIAHLQAVLTVNSTDLGARLFLARELLKANRQEEALAEFTRVVQADRNNEPALVELVQLLAASPQVKLRNGTQALKLAQTLYAKTASLQHGALVGLALAELGRCNEAAEWQRKMIAGAAKEGNNDLQAKLKADLQRYENAQSCRP